MAYAGALAPARRCLRRVPGGVPEGADDQDDRNDPVEPLPRDRGITCWAISPRIALAAKTPPHRREHEVGPSEAGLVPALARRGLTGVLLRGRGEGERAEGDDGEGAARDRLRVVLHPVEVGTVEEDREQREDGEEDDRADVEDL